MKSLRSLLQRVLVGAWRSPAARVFFAVWLVILLIEPLRHIASTVQQDDNVYSKGFRSSELEACYGEHLVHEDSQSCVQEALAKIVALPKERALAHTVNGVEVQESNVLFDKLLTKHPKDGVFAARYIIGALSRYNYQPLRVPHVPGHTFYSTPPTQSQAQIQQELLQKIIIVAKRGQKIEPNNAFFDAVLIVCYVQLKRDAEAYRVLAASRHKTVYDAHSMDVLRATATELKRMQPHLVEYQISLLNWGDWDSDIQFVNTAEVLLQENWRADQQNRATQSRVWRLNSLQRRADIAQMQAKILSGRSPQLYHDYRRTLFKVWRNDWSKSFFGRVRFTYQNQVLSERFAREATALDQLQIAAQTRDIAAKNEQIFRAVKQSPEEPFAFQKLRWLSRLQGLVLVQMAVAVALYILASLLLLFADRTPHHNHTAWKSAIAGSSGGALCLVVAYSLISSGMFNVLDPNISQRMVAFFITCLVAFLALPFMVIALWHVVANDGAPHEGKSLQARLHEYSISPPLRKIYDFAAFSILSQLWFLAALHYICALRGVSEIELPIIRTVYTNIENGFYCLVWSLPVIVLYFMLLWRWPSFLAQRASSHAKLRSFRAACGVMLATGSVLFLLCLLASLPTRRDIARHFDEYLLHDGLWLVQKNQKS